MLKYTNYQLTFSEIPEEVTLCINLSNCPIHCKDCHSKFLWGDNGTELTEDMIDLMLESKNADLCTCVCFMGGDNDHEALFKIAKYVKERKPEMKTGWYSGLEEADKRGLEFFDYIKTGGYDAEKGSLKFETTNQRLYKIVDKEMIDITNKFWL